MDKFKKQLIYIGIIIMIVGGVSFKIYKIKNNNEIFKMGGKLIIENHIENDEEVYKQNNDYDLEKYFRPSKLSILNNKEYNFNDLYDKKPSEISIPNELLKTPQETILNYYSILREAANPIESKNTGCGTLGYAKIPYPLAYNFLTKFYQEKVSYEEYIESFKNILHTNLIKIEQVATDKEHLDSLKYFVEIETIEGSDSGVGYFAYYYGYIYLKEEDDKYKINQIDYYGENYLCAPYHGWAWNAEYSVDIKYGGWCKLIKEKYPTEQDGYKKRIKFLGNDGNEYMILFYELTNGTDIEIAQYIKNSEGKWININLDAKKCLDKKTPNK